jgi:peptide/nickel transport system permease protein
MVSYLLNRILQAGLVMLVMSAIVFLGVFAIGNPVDILISPQATALQREEAIRALGLDLPVWHQYLNFLSNLLHGDLGRSFVFNVPALQLILERMPATLELAIAATLLALVAGIPLGLYAGLAPKSPVSSSIMAGSILGFSLPSFWVGIVLIMLFSVHLGWLPSSGRGDTAVWLGVRWSFLTADGLAHMAMPVLNLALFQISMVIRLTRAGVREVILSDYVKFARAKGLRGIAHHPRPYPEEHPDPGCHRRRAQPRDSDSFRRGDGDHLLLAGNGKAHHRQHKHPGSAGDRRLPHADGAHVRDHQPARRPDLFRSRSARAPGKRMMAAISVRSIFGSRKGGEQAPFRRFVAEFAASRLAVLGLVVLSMIGLIAIFAPWLAPQNPYDLAQLDIMDGMLEPATPGGSGFTYWLGTDEQGRDMLSAIMYGLRISLFVGAGSAVLASVVGATLGLVAAYFGGKTDALIMRWVDLQLSFPSILVALLILALLGRGVMNVVMALVIVEWAYYARTARAAALVERNREYVEAAQCLALPTRRIVFRHLLPNCLPPLIVIATMQVASAIALEATLSFLGLGVPVTEPSLGLLISNGYQYMLSGNYWISFYPGVALLVTIVAINLVGDHLRDVLNPRLKS